VASLRPPLVAALGDANWWVPKRRRDPGSSTRPTPDLVEQS
jgi:hypothetical protein